MRDPYEVLGVPRTATAEAIKSSYRKLAKQYHPDLHPGDSTNEGRFKEISAAYDLLSDTAKRGRFDRGEIDASGAERPNARQYRAYSNRTSNPRPGGGLDADEIFEMFRQARRGNPPGGGAAGGGASRGGSADEAEAASRRRGKGADATYTITVDFVGATAGTKRRLTLPDGKVLDVAIPPGTSDGSTLRLRGQGIANILGDEPGDALIEVQVEPHPFFERRGQDIHVEVPVALNEAVLGSTITVPTIDGKVAVKVPKGANTGTVLRLRGRGVAGAKEGQRGDQYVKLTVVLPDKPDAELVTFMEGWAARHAYRVRTKLGVED